MVVGQCPRQSGLTKFPAWPELQPIGKGEYFKLLEDYVYGGITVPAGFVFNMASTPRVIWTFISPFDLGPSAVIHDWLYNTHYDFTRKDADQILMRMMQQSGISRWKRHAAYRAVRLLGRGAWRAGD